MKISAAILAAASLSLLPYVYADADIDIDSEEPAPVAPTGDAVSVDRPQFQPTKLTAPFLEQFTDDWEDRWKASHATKYVKDGDEQWQFVGQWEVEEPTIYKGIDGDKGLVVKNEAAHHAISSKFPKAIDPKGKTLVVQYEVKLQNGLECGGAYMKLLQDNKALHNTEFSNASPYVIMFGPDRCGSTNKVHFIFRHKNPKSGEYEEKHMSEDVSANIEKTTQLYTLVVHPNQTYEMRINGKAEQTGSLLKDFTPAVNPPKEVDDPDDKKPEDWVENAKIADPDAKKPDDWDEDAPFQIVDEAAVKPDDWLDNEPAMVPDPEASKPTDWDDEEDGDWQAPLVANPKCSDVSGCGEWTKPMIKNPDYRGKWVADLVDNPEYKGVWKPRKIANKNYFEDKTPANFEPIGGIGFELWTMQSGILFDNIYIGHSIEDADALKRETYDIKSPIETKLEDAAEKVDTDKPKPKLTRGKTDGNFFSTSITYVREQLNTFIPLFREDWKAAVTGMPEVAGGIVIVMIAVAALITSALGVGAAQPEVQEQAKKAKAKAAEAKDKVSESVTTGAEKVQSEVNKRTTRSSAD